MVIDAVKKMDIAGELRKFIKGEVDDGEETLAKYSHDASLFELKPAAVVSPKDAEDVKKLVSFVSKNKKKEPELSLTVRSGGTDMTGAALSESIVIDVNRHLNRFKGIKNGRAVAEPGIFYRDFEKETLEEGLLLPSFPASREICTVGGMIANNSGGEKNLAYGKTENYVQEIKMVLRDGNEYVFRSLDRKELGKKIKAKGLEGGIYRKIYGIVSQNASLLEKARPKVSKNSAGYYLWNVWDGKTFDLTKLLVGSQGTLGIITEATLRLVKPKEHSKMFVIFLKDFKDLGEIINKVLVHKPESFESYDDHTLKLAVRFFPNMIKIMKIGNIFYLAWQFLPEFWMTLTGGLPKLIMIAEFTGDIEKEVEEKVRAVYRDIKPFGLKTRITKSVAESQKYKVVRRESFNLLRHHVKDKQTAPFIDDIIVRPEQLPEFLPKLDGIMKNYDLIYTVAGHIGDANFHIIPLMDLRDERVKEIIPELSRKVYDLVFEFGGSITAEHNDGLIRSPYLKDMYGEKVYKLFEKVKYVFDPDNIFNPGKKVGASLEYALAHLKKPK